MRSEFDRSQWAKPEFSQGYRDNADNFIVERQQMLMILQSHYVHFVKDGEPKRILDLGCGDGIVTAALAAVDPALAPILVDGSPDMLEKAAVRLRGVAAARFIRATFEELISADTIGFGYDFIVSALAIHHLAMADKKGLFSLIHERLQPGGWFVNLDVVLAPTDRIERWYMRLWGEWIAANSWQQGIPKDSFAHIPNKYKEAEENQPDTLQDQLHALTAQGFREVDCFYKYGIFTVFGGRREA